MKRFALALLAIAPCALSSTAHAANELFLLNSSDAFNSAILNVTGDENRLSIVQEHFGGPTANTISLNIQGSFNGGPLGAQFTGAAATQGLTPGSLVQRGFGNVMSYDVIGSHNLIAAAQIGSGNVISASIVGNSNQSSVTQSGTGNFVGFSQSGFGNTVSITQTSW